MQDPRIYQAFEDGLTTGEFTPADQAFFTSAGPAPLLSHIHIPVLLMQGTDDTLFTLHEAITNYDALQNQRRTCADALVLRLAVRQPGRRPRSMPDAQGTRSADHPALRAALAGSLPQTATPASTPVPGSPGSRTPGPSTRRRATRRPAAARDRKRLGNAAVARRGHLGRADRGQPRGQCRQRAPEHSRPGTELLGEPTLTLNYSGTAANPDGRLYAQILSNANGLVLGNQVTPLPGHP